MPQEILTDKLKFKRFIQSQASLNGNSVAADDWSRDGNTEYTYPKRFEVNGRVYEWNVSSKHVKGRHLTTTYEIWLSEKGRQSNERIATGPSPVNKTNLNKVIETVRQRELNYTKNN